MIAVLQRVLGASVTADGTPSGTIGAGLLILLGVARGDTEQDAVLLADKIAKLRIFSDENGKMNRSVTDVGGQVCVVSNFTLLANYAHGNRPDYFGGEEPVRANVLYSYFLDLMRVRVAGVASGVFGADMKIRMECDGPVTICMDSRVLARGKQH